MSLQGALSESAKELAAASMLKNCSNAAELSWPPSLDDACVSEGDGGDSIGQGLAIVYG
jgi:hypothetical protein